MKKQRTKDHWLQNAVVICLGATLCSILWGSAFPCIKIGYELFDINAADTASQILFAGFRFTLAGILAILAGSISTRQFLYPEHSAIGKVLLLCLFQTVLQYFFFYVGLAHTSGVKASIIEAVNVFVAILVASVLFRQEKLTIQKMVGCGVGFIGVILINLSGMDLNISVQGEGFIFLSTVAYAFSSVLFKRFSKDCIPVMLSGYQFVFGGLIMAAAGAALGGTITTITASGLLLLFYLAFVSAAAYTLWGILLKYNPISKVAVYGFMTPVCGVILSAVMLKEQDQATGFISVISLILVCIGIYIVNREKKFLIQS